MLLQKRYKNLPDGGGPEEQIINLKRIVVEIILNQYILKLNYLYA